MNVTFAIGDITEQQVDVIVNAANKLLRGSGVCGAYPNPGFGGYKCGLRRGVPAGICDGYSFRAFAVFVIFVVLLYEFARRAFLFIVFHQPVVWCKKV